MVPKNTMKRLSRFAVAVLLLLLGFTPLLSKMRVAAYDLPSARFIQMSSSAYGTNPNGDGTDVVYQVGFTTNQGGASATIGAVVIEFCQNSPIIGDTCTAPTGFDANAHTGSNTTVVIDPGGSAITDFQKSTTNATANRVVLTRTGGPAAVATAQNIRVQLGNPDATSNGVTNPSILQANNTYNSTFYARIVTFEAEAGAFEYEADDIDDAADDTDYSGTDDNQTDYGYDAHEVVEAGGIALSTAEQITITARVPERITFCVFTQDDTVAPNSCGTGAGAADDLGGNAVTLGNENGVLDFTGPYVDKTAQYSIATNASLDVAIRARGTTLKRDPSCPDGPTQACSIDAIGGGTVEANSVAGTEQFGFCSYESAGTPSAGLGGLAIEAEYDGDDGAGLADDCASTTQTAGAAPTGGVGANGDSSFAFIEADVTSTYGDLFAIKEPGVFSTGVIAFVGNIALVTEPGIYTTTLTFIATGTY